MRRWLRCLVCLLMVCALIVNISPIKAKASVAGTLGVAAGVVVTSLMIGLIGNPNASEAVAEVLYDTVNGAVDFLTLNYDFVTDDQKIQVWATGNSDMPYAVDQSLIEAMFGWIWDNEVVTSTEGLTLATSGSFSAGGSSYTWSASSDSFVAGFSFSSSSSVSIYAFQESGSFYLNSSFVGSNYWSKSNSASTWYALLVSGPTRDTVSGIPVYDVPSSYSSISSYLQNEWVPSFGGGSITTTSGLTVGEVAPAGTAIAEGYPVWAENAITVKEEDGTERVVYPITLAQAYENSLAITQADVWAGVGSTYVATDTETDTEAGTGTGTGTVVVPEMAGFTLDLKAYFPFCIPFDLYDFLTCLNADPVAPVIDWQIPLPTGGTYPMTIDLSPFDSVASILRTLELLVFCIGLGVKTRDLIKG